MTSRTQPDLPRMGFSRRGAALGGLAMLGALAACGPRSPGAAAGGSAKVLKVASQKGGTKALVLASGALHGATYRVEWSEFPAAQHLLEALSAGAVDVGGVGDAPFIFAYASGVDIRAVQASRSAGGGASTVILVPASSPLRTVQALKGRKVATGRGSIGHYVLLRVLDRAGLKPKDVDIVFLSPGDAKAAFSTGAIDAWSTWGAYVGAAVLHDGARALADGQGLLSGYGFQAATPAAIAGKREALDDFLHRLVVALHWGIEHKEAYAGLLAQETGLPLDVARYTVARIGAVPVPIGPAVLAEEQQTLARFQAAGAIGKAPDLSAAFDASFNDAVTT